MTIDSELRVLEFRGRTSAYLEQPAGAASLDFLRMIREDLLTDVRTVLEEAMKSEAPAKRQSMVIDDAGRSEHLTIEVIPFRAAVARAFFMCSFVLRRAKSGRFNAFTAESAARGCR